MKLVSSETIFSCKRFSVQSDIYMIKSKANEYIYLKARPAVAAIPVYRDGIILVEQYRASIKERLLELPGGRCENGMTLEDAMLKELREEIGVAKCELIYFDKYYPLPSIITQEITYFKARINKLVRPEREPSERDMKMYLIPINLIGTMLDKGVLKSSSDSVALYKFIFQARNEQIDISEFDIKKYLLEVK